MGKFAGTGAQVAFTVCCWLGLKKYLSLPFAILVLTVIKKLTIFANTVLVAILHILSWLRAKPIFCGVAALAVRMLVE